VPHCPRACRGGRGFVGTAVGPHPNPFGPILGGPKRRVDDKYDQQSAANDGERTDKTATVSDGVDAAYRVSGVNSAKFRRTGQNTMGQTLPSSLVFPAIFAAFIGTSVTAAMLGRSSRAAYYQGLWAKALKIAAPDVPYPAVNAWVFELCGVDEDCPQGVYVYIVFR